MRFTLILSLLFLLNGYAFSQETEVVPENDGSLISEVEETGTESELQVSLETDDSEDSFTPLGETRASEDIGVLGEFSTTGSSMQWSFYPTLEASLLWGANFDTGATGFENRWALDLVLELQREAESGDQPHGYFSVEDLQLRALNGNGSFMLTPNDDETGDPFAVTGGVLSVDYGEILAGIGMGPWYTEFYGLPDLEVNQASQITSVSAGLVDSRVKIQPEVNGGFTVGYEEGPLLAELEVASRFGWLLKPAIPGVNFTLNWDDENGGPQSQEIEVGETGSFDNIDNEYAVSFLTEYYPVETFFMSLAGTSAFSYNSQVHGGGLFITNELKTSYLTMYIPIFSVDVLYDNTSSELSYEAGGGFRLRWDGAYEEEVDNVVFGDETTIYSGFTFGISVSQVDFQDPVMDMTASIWDDQGDGGLIPLVGLGLSFEAADVINEFQSALKGFVELDFQGIRPYLGGNYEYNKPVENIVVIDPDADPVETETIITNEDFFYAMAGIRLEDVFSFMELGIAYGSGNLLAEDIGLGELILEASILFE